MNISAIKNTILFEDENYFIINKPSYISTLQDNSANEPESLYENLLNYNPALKVCHRLDKETSGVMVFAKNDASFKHLSAQFEHHKIEKIYHAIASGNRDFIDFLADFPISITSRNHAKIDILNGKESVTILNSLKKFRKCQWIECKPKTGRMHQIRVHLSYLNSSILGDVEYGGKHLTLSDLKRDFKHKKEEEPKPLIKRTALHALSICFESIDGKSLSFSAPYPKDFSTCLKILEKWG
ncbi:MAG: hypothetical protein A3G23_13670 [Bacteroidetes bacterium RIFCSPLOWO2_12_FULL_37_12]|nr:MAG: hypothetical protein A3G23_13670 [Bacteroidetes bacterium RIFCSPLOWO2_12_FULL_37_12]